MYIKTQSNYEPLISVLMPCYNGERFLRQAIESILVQTYNNFEFIIINDGSSDATGDIIKEYRKKDQRIVTIDKTNSGIVDSLNIGIYRARGIWLARLDADDIALPDRLECQLRLVQKDSSIGLVGSSYIMISEDGVPLREVILPDRHELLVKRLVGMRSFFTHSSAFYRKDLVVQLGGYRKRAFPAEDIDLWLRFCEISVVKCLSSPMVMFRINSGGLSCRNYKEQRLAGVMVRIAHLRRLSGFSDPLAFPDEDWNKFKQHVDDHLKELSYYDYIHKSNLRLQAFQKQNDSYFLRSLQRAHWLYLAIENRVRFSGMLEKMTERSMAIWP